MEKAILKTLIYADIFDYPLTIFEVHKWLIGMKVTLRQVEKALKKLNQESRIKNKGEYYFLHGKHRLVSKRQRRQTQSAQYLRKAQLITIFLKAIPWIKLVGVSGGLAMDNADKNDDIDLFIITSKNRLWISRLLALGLLSLTGQRRKAGDLGQKIAGKLCINTLLEEDKLEQANKDIYLAHEVLQMKVLWQRNGIYSKYLLDNEWVFKFLPSWVGDARGPATSSLRGVKRRSNLINKEIATPFGLAMTDYLERLAKWFQLKVMRKPEGMERIEDGALYFHPQDCRPKVLAEYGQKLKKIISP
ncbi:hypothetical protein HYT18_01540 [Candidatus Microgenomates bacterium]|nr:hypothetical protein [Candidatus Microgenomates bacterium]